jgi:hypothetical protein
MGDAEKKQKKKLGSAASWKIFTALMESNSMTKFKSADK